MFLLNKLQYYIYYISSKMGFTKDKDKSEEETNSQNNEKNAKKNQEN